MLKAVGLSKSFGPTQALNNLSFQVNAGEIVALLGPNGAGKTTTVKLAAGLLRPTAGEILIAGLPTSDPRAHGHVALVPEVPALYELLTVWEHLRFIAAAFRLQGWEGRAQELLERFDLLEKRDELAGSLSKGMRQKLLIIAALLHEPRVLLFDEPLVGLDPKAARELKDFIVELKNRGAAILISTHMLDTAERLCDRVLLLKKGTLLAEGSVPELRERFHLPVDTPLEDVFLQATT